jgi:hypothetical protein
MNSLPSPGENVPLREPVKATSSWRLTVDLSEADYKEMTSLAVNNRVKLSDFVRLGLALVRLALKAKKSGHKIIVTKANGTPLREIVLPSYPPDAA